MKLANITLITVISIATSMIAVKAQEGKGYYNNEYRPSPTVDKNYLEIEKQYYSNNGKTVIKQTQHEAVVEQVLEEKKTNKDKKH